MKMQSLFLSDVVQSPPRSSGRLRRLLAAGTLALASLALPLGAQADQGLWDTSQQWVGTWGTAPAGPPLPAQTQTFNDQTLRLIVHTSIGGKQVRIRVSNELGSTPLRIGAAHIALRQAGADIVAGSDRVLTFSGSTSITVPAGAPVLSDPVDLDVPALGDLAVSLYLPGEVQATTIHGSAFQTNYVSLPGNFTGAATLPTQRTITSWPFLTEVDVSAPGAGAIVALGDSITDGAVTTVDANRRWPDLLALRLQTTRDSVTGDGGAGTVAGAGAGKSTSTSAGRNASTGASTGVSTGASTGASAGKRVSTGAGSGASAGKASASQAAPATAAPALRALNSRLGVVNRGIGGDRLLRDPGEQPLFGRAALVRFDRDVLATSGVRHLIVLIGINDIGHPGTGTIPVTEAVTAQDLIAGYRQLIARAHAKGIPVYGATLTPFEGTIFPGYYSPEKEAVRQAVNNWIRGSDEFDAVIDFDRAVRDPANPTRMLPAYDSGDHLHPNDLGMQAMANAIPLDLFRNSGAAVAAVGQRQRK